MLISCLLVSHDKKYLCCEAIDSVTSQTHQDWELIITDSGILYDQGYFDKYKNDPRIKVIRSDETEETRRTKALAPWCFNQMYKKGLVSGQITVFLTDDDIYYFNAFEVINNFMESNPSYLAMYSSQDIGVIKPDGRRFITGQRLTSGLKGKCCKGGKINCVCDYMQFAIRTTLLSRASWPEGKNTESHADGVFFESIGSLTPIYPCPVVISQNRRTPQSTYNPSR